MLLLYAFCTAAWPRAPVLTLQRNPWNLPREGKPHRHEIWGSRSRSASAALAPSPHSSHSQPVSTEAATELTVITSLVGQPVFPPVWPIPSQDHQHLPAFLWSSLFASDRLGEVEAQQGRHDAMSVIECAMTAVRTES